MFDSRFGSRLGLALVLATVASCGPSRRVFVARAVESEATVARIGLQTSLTGADAAMQADIQRGFSSAVDEWNASPAALQLRIEVVTYDDQSRTAAAAVAVERLARDDRVHVVVSGSKLERAAQAAAACPSAVVVCPTCPREGAAVVIGLAPSLHERAELLADLVVRTMQMNKVAVLGRQGVASDETAAQAFRSSLNTRGVTAVESVTFTPESIADVLARLAQDAPQAVLVAMDGLEAALVGRALRRRAVPSALLFFGAPEFAALPEADRVAALEGALFPTVFVAARQDADTQRFVAAWQARSANPPSENAFIGYAAGRRVFDLLSSRSELDPAGLKTAFLAVRHSSALAIVRVERGVPIPLLPVRE